MVPDPTRHFASATRSCVFNVDGWVKADDKLSNKGLIRNNGLLELTTDASWSDGKIHNRVGADLDVHAGWKNALAGLNDEVLEAELGDVLDKRRLKSLRGRRDQLLTTGDAEPQRLR